MGACSYREVFSLTGACSSRGPSHYLKVKSTPGVLPWSLLACQRDQQHQSKLMMPVGSSEVWCSSVQGNKVVYVVLSAFPKLIWEVHVSYTVCVLPPEKAVLLLSSNLADLLLPSLCLRCGDCVAAGQSWLSLMGVLFPL